MKRNRRFYKSVEVSPECGILLDGKPVKTPMKRPLILPSAALASAVAEEWESQGERIDPRTMPLTRLANTALDRVAPERAPIIAEMLDFAGSDLVCYRAEAPLDLVERQAAHWNPVLDWGRCTLGAGLQATTGIVHRRQPRAPLDSISQHLHKIDSFQLTALHNQMTLTGSLLLVLMMQAGAIAPDAAWKAAHVDEDFQIEQWGEDEEASLRRQARREEFLACCRFAELASRS